MWVSAASVMCRVLAAAAVVLLLWPARAQAQPADERWDEEGDEWMEEPDALEAAAALDQVRERVMRELGLTSQPVRNATDAEIEEVMREYHRLVAQQKREQDYADDSEDYASSGSFHTVIDQGWQRSSGASDSTSPRTRTSSGINIFFPLTSAGLEAHERVVGGTLRLYLHQLTEAPVRPVRLTVYQLSSTGPLPRRRRLQDVTVSSSGWHEFNISAAAEQWRARPDQNHGLQVECRRCQGAVRLVAGGEDTETAPRLVLHTKMVRRTKRAGDLFSSLRRGRPLDCKRGPRKKCCRQKMEVNFKELGGFDFIIKPKVFSAYYCRGRCPPSYNVASDHALLQGWIYQKRKRSGGRRVPRTCCVPSKLSPLAIVHLDQAGRPKLTFWENVVADECKCS